MNKESNKNSVSEKWVCCDKFDHVICRLWRGLQLYDTKATNRAPWVSRTPGYWETCKLTSFRGLEATEIKFCLGPENLTETEFENNGLISRHENIQDVS